MHWPHYLKEKFIKVRNSIFIITFLIIILKKWNLKSDYLLILWSFTKRKGLNKFFFFPFSNRFVKCNLSIIRWICNKICLSGGGSDNIFIIYFVFHASLCSALAWNHGRMNGHIGLHAFKVWEETLRGY